jgi:prevent-host-death family protein
MTQVTVDEAGAQLGRLLQAAREGEEVVLTQDDLPVARLVPLDLVQQEHGQSKKPRAQRGSGKGLFYMSPDFDEPLADFKEYME